MYGNLIHTGVFKLFHQVTHAIRRAPNPQLMLKDAIQTIGWGFELDRCLILLFDHQQQEIEVKAEFSRDGAGIGGPRRYQLLSSSEWYRLLLEGRPLPLKEIRLEGSKPGSLPELNQLVVDSQSQSLVAFPLAYQGQFWGCLTMHHCRETKSLSDELLEVGEAVAEELAVALAQAQLAKEKDLDSRIFRESSLPSLLLHPDTYHIFQANNACAELLAPKCKDLKGLSLLELLADSDSQRVRQAVDLLGAGQPMVFLEGLVARSAEGEGLMTLNASVSLLETDEVSGILLSLMPGSKESTNGSGCPDAEPAQLDKLEELVKTLSRQLNWERIARHMISSVHATLDRDAVLQSTADMLGRALNVSRCLIVRTEGPVSPMVTHEYVEPDISPLGLGRTSQFPLTAISCFKHKTTAIADVSSNLRPSGLSQQDLEELMESGVQAMLGAPISHHGSTYGAVILVQTGRAKQWSAAEVELVELVSEQAAIALGHAQSYEQTKDQLFNMNLIGNLTQQLTNALDLAARAGKPEMASEAARQPGTSIPLSMRELEVLKLIASGLANREIAQRLFLTESTVELHASRIRKKLKLKSRTALVKYACDNHLV